RCALAMSALPHEMAQKERPWQECGVDMAERIIVLRQGNHPVLMERQPMHEAYHEDATVCPITTAVVALVKTTCTAMSASSSNVPPAGGVRVTPSSISSIAAVARMLNVIPDVYGSAASKVTSPPARTSRVSPSCVPGSAVKADASVTMV